MQLQPNLQCAFNNISLYVHNADGMLLKIHPSLVKEAIEEFFATEQRGEQSGAIVVNYTS